MDQDSSCPKDIKKCAILFRPFGVIIVFGIILAAFDWCISSEASIFRQSNSSEKNILNNNSQTHKKTNQKNSSTQKASLTNFESSLPECDVRTKVESPIFMVADQMPEFLGGEQELTNFIRNRIKSNNARNSSIKGKICLRFVITESGDITKVSVMKGINPEVDSEAIESLKCMNKWTPANQEGTPVSVWKSLAIIL